MLNEPQYNPLQKSIYRHMQQKETAELLGIWMKQDRNDWSNEAFEVICDILLERLGSPQAIEEAAKTNIDNSTSSPDRNRERRLSKDQKITRTIAILEIVGGVYGVIFAAFYRTSSSNHLGTMFLFVPALLLLIAGVLLFDNHKLGLLLSLLIQGLQIIRITAGGFGYMLVLTPMVTLLFSADKINFYTTIDNLFYADIVLSERRPWEFGINILALVIFVYLFGQYKILGKEGREVKEKPTRIKPKPYSSKIPKLGILLNNKSSGNTILPFNPWGFGVLWVLLHIIGLFLIGALVTPLLSMILMPLPLSIHPFEKWKYILIIDSFVAGLIIGGIEWYFLQKYFEWPKAWIVATVIGFTLSRVWLNFTLEWFHFLLGLISIEVGVFLINAAVSGVLLGIAQWFVLRGKIDNAYLWILASLISGVAGAFVVELYFRGINDLVNPDSFEQVVINVLKQVVVETVRVACLIGVLILSLKRDKMDNLSSGVT